MGARKHIATQWHQAGGGSILRCRCGGWESNPKETARAQRDAHRAHRVEMGEMVAPRQPTVQERLKAAEAAIARVRCRAEEWAELAEPGDESAASLDRAVADSGRDVLAALDGADADRG